LPELELARWQGLTWTEGRASREEVATSHHVFIVRVLDKSHHTTLFDRYSLVPLSVFLAGHLLMSPAFALREVNLVFAVVLETRQLFLPLQ
jgi:hypothetical protein